MVLNGVPKTGIPFAAAASQQSVVDRVAVRQDDAGDLELQQRRERQPPLRRIERVQIPDLGVPHDLHAVDR